MKAIHLVNYGDPLEGLKCVEIPEPEEPQNNDVLIRVEFSPINVSDLLRARGLFGTGIVLPAVIGGEGAGTVIAAGGDVISVKIGDRVLLPYGTFAWAEKVIASAEDIFVVNPAIDAQQASMLSINPPTAGLLLSEFVDLIPGDWIVQNSANSGVGRAVIAIAKCKGVKTINIVRRSELLPELKALGADFVVVASATAVEQIKTHVGDAPVRLALDGVSGAASQMLAEVLTLGGTIVSYAAPTEEPITVSPFTLIAKKLSVRPLSMYYPELLPKLHGWMERSAELIELGKLHAPVAASYPASSLTQALKHAMGGGKVLLDFTQPS